MSADIQQPITPIDLQTALSDKKLRKILKIKRQPIDEVTTGRTKIRANFQQNYQHQLKQIAKRRAKKKMGDISRRRNRAN